MRRLKVCLLGPFEVTVDGVAVTGFTYAKVRALLAYLAADGPFPRRRAELATLLWPDHSERSARVNLSTALSMLRTALGDTGAARPLVLSDTQTVQLDPQCSVDVDATRFLTVLRATEAHPHRSWRTCAACAARLREALELYRGEFLAAVSIADSAVFEEWTAAQREQLHQRALSALERLVERAQWCGAYGEALRYAQRLVELEPLLEAHQRACIRLAALNGETAAALAHYRQLQRVLATELATEPERATTVLVEQIRRGETERLQPARSTMVAPYPPTPLIGRGDELEASCAALQDLSCRLLTITGVGGIGKTRLAIATALALRHDFEDGVYVVELAALSDASRVAAAVARRLGVPERPQQPIDETLRDYLHARHVLLVLDNFEHVVTAAPLVGELLAACPALSVLATSRAPLELRAEQQYILEPLAEADAVQLLVERVQAAGGRVSAQPADIALYPALCRRLDRLPLAIELAAPRIKLFTPSQLLEQLHRRLDVLGRGPSDLPPRQRTLRAAIEWSYNLLNTDEQLLFRRLAVFTGGCALPQVELVCRSAPQTAVSVADGVEALLNQSLLHHQEAEPGTLRFVMFETIHDYAHERLSSTIEYDAIRRLHAHAYVELAEESKPHLNGPHQAVWIRRLDVEQANFRAALNWLRTAPGGADLELRLVTALMQFWQVRGYFSEGRACIQGALERSDGGSAARAAAYKAAGFLAIHCDDFAAARAMLVQSLAHFEQLGDLHGRAESIWMLGIVAENERDFDQAVDLYQCSLALLRPLADEWGVAVTLFLLGNVAYVQGDYQRAHSLVEESLALCRILENSWAVGRRLARLGHVALAQQDVARAAELQQASLKTSAEVHDTWGTLMALAGIAGVASARGRYERAARLFGATSALLDAMGARLWFADRVDYDRHLAAARDRLVAARFAAAWNEGRALTLDQAVAYGQDEGDSAMLLE